MARQQCVETEIDHDRNGSGSCIVRMYVVNDECVLDSTSRQRGLAVVGEGEAGGRQQRESFCIQFRNHTERTYMQAEKN